MIRLKREVQLGLILFEDHEADRTSVLENFGEAENLRIEIAGSRDVLDREHRGNSSKADTMTVAHREPLTSL
jgi:hypothetical protein